MFRLVKLSFILFLSLLVSCQQYIDSSTIIDSNTQELFSVPEAQKQFAIILSKAVSENEDVRAFIKWQALSQFDNDYDVFYPIVKNYSVSGSSSFRDVLLDYCDDEQLCIIEASLPKLTIYVPDYSWVDNRCFNVNHWDTGSNVVVVGYDDRLAMHPIYYAGEKVGELEAESFPEFPTLIVKENERIVASSSTKGEIQYSFVSPVFDGRKRGITKADHWLFGDTDEILNNDEAPGDNLISEVGNRISYSELNAISPETISAYNEFGTGWNNACQRDYIYYNMSTVNSDHGILKMFEKDLLYRFALTPYSLLDVADADGEDPIMLNNGYVSRNSDRPDCAEAVRRMWGNGHYEIKIDVYQKTGTVPSNIITSYYFDLEPSELMYVSKCNLNYHWNVFGQSWNTYTIQQSFIEPKWYYPKGLSLSVIDNHWNLATASDNVCLLISEVDDAATITTTTSLTFKQSNTVSLTTSTSGEAEAVKSSYGTSNSYTIETSSTETKTIVKKQDSDDMGPSSIAYIDNIVTGADASGYYLKCYSTGRFLFSVIPVDMSNELSIINYLNNNH